MSCWSYFDIIMEGKLESGVVDFAVHGSCQIRPICQKVILKYGAAKIVKNVFLNNLEQYADLFNLTVNVNELNSGPIHLAIIYKQFGILRCKFIFISTNCILSTLWSDINGTPCRFIQQREF